MSGWSSGRGGSAPAWLVGRARDLAALLEAKSRPSRLSPVALAILVTIACLSWYHAHRDLPWRLRSGDSHEYAEMGRRLARGDGFTTGIIFPAELHLGASDEHPAVVRPPGWPLAIAAAFRVAEPREAAVYGLLFLVFLGIVVSAAMLASHSAGGMAGILAGIAVATSSDVLLFTLDGAAELSFTLWVTLFFLLSQQRRPPVVLGLVAGVAYLTRYNGLVLLPAAWLLVAGRKEVLRPVLWVAGGFLVVALPWWLRNLALTGDPFYSLLNLNLHFSPLVSQPNSSLLFMLEPDLESASAMDPIEKFQRQLPELLRAWPPASLSPLACLGVGLACVRLERVSLAWALVAAGTTLGVAFGLPHGRYFVPLLPSLLALGVAVWMRSDRRAGVLALALLLLAPTLPPIVAAPRDLRFFKAVIAAERAIAGEGLPTSVDAKASCLDDRPLVLAQGAARLNWETEAISIYAPSRAEDFWRILDTYPVRFVQIERWGEISRKELEVQFVPRRDCAENLYERRHQPGRER